MSGEPLAKPRHGGRHNPLRTRLGRKLLGWFLVLSLVPLLGSNMIGYLYSRGTIEALIERQLIATAGMQTPHIGEQIERLKLGLEMVAAANESFALGTAALPTGEPERRYDGPTLDELEGRLRLKLNETWEFDGLYLQSADSRVLASAGISKEEAETLISAPSAETGFEALEVRFGRPRFRLTVPLRDADRNLVGTLGAVMGQRGIGSLLEIPEHLAGSIESFIVDESGYPIFISHIHSGESYGMPLQSPLVEAGAGPLARYVDRQGMDVIGIAAPIEGLGWRYIAEYPVSAALGPLRFLRRVSVIFGGACALMLAIAAWFVAGGIVAPVRRLVGAARRVGNGDLDVRVKTKGNDEVAELGAAFNEMTSDLAEAHARVEDLHAREIERAQQLATVGELATGVAHEIKNPVVGISGGLDLVRRRIGQDGDLEPIMEEMSRQLARIEIAVRDLLTFARPPTPDLQPADANEIAQRATRLVEPAAEQARVTVSQELDPDLPPLLADGELVRQALVNLLMNALQATPAGGRVTLSTSLANGEIRFTVLDTGSGIPSEKQEEIFKPFYTTRHAGSGLGLSITRTIAERHGGEIEVQSHLGQGSSFTVRIPVGEGEAQAPRLSRKSAPEGGAEGGVP